MSPLTVRPPAVPLITHDPYFSGWSFSDTLTESDTRHWTGSSYGMCSLVRVDGAIYRLMGTRPEDVPAMPQTSLEVTPTRTVYQFTGAGVEITLTFLSPLLPDDLDILSRPATYLTWEARAADGAAHDVSVYFHAQSEWVVDKTEESVISSRYQLPGLQVLRMGSEKQPILEKSGDNLRIDWGYLYLAVPSDGGSQTALTQADTGRTTFAQTGRVPETDDMAFPRAARDNWPVLACALSLGSVAETSVSRHVTLAYDDLYAIEYFYRKVRPYWRRSGLDAAGMLSAAASDYEALTSRCRTFDTELMADLVAAGGEKYAALCALAYRQCISAHKLAADYDGTPLFLSKENFSNGCIATVDVTYPSAPLFLLLNPKLLRAMLTPILDYAQTDHWRFPFAPHDLGTYPLCNGQVYGGGERTEDDQMPVEECGNMLILLAALAQAEGDADYARKYWPLLTRWAEYLLEKGLDPDNQLCTDDFAGHLAHNVNLSLKAIMGLGGFAKLCEKLGHSDLAETTRAAALKMAEQWVTMADDGDHFRLAFDKPGTWSQKYNLVWDSLLGLNLFGPEVARKEVAYYLTKQNQYGLPLDSRSEYTKLDWIVWTATLTETPPDFAALTDPLFRWMNEGPTRVPLTDWYWTTDGHMEGFQARSVVGGLYLPLLKNASIWKKWVGRTAS